MLRCALHDRTNTFCRLSKQLQNMKKGLLMPGFCLLVLKSWAQGTGEVYAAPGMPVRMQGSVTVPTPRPARKTAAPTAKNTEAVPLVSPPINSPIFSRFWHQAEPVRSQAGKIYYQFQRQNIKYPVTSLRAGLGGRIAARLTVMPDGRVGRVRIIRCVVDEDVASIDGPSPAAEAALDAEVLRVVSQMRFESSTVSEDTVTVIQRFVFR